MNLFDIVRGLSAGYVFRRPAQLPASVVISANTYLQNTGNTYTASDAGFWSSIANAGAIVSVTAADSWTQVCSVTGAGYLGFAISPMHTSAHVPELRITADGVARTITSTATPANYRCVVGALCQSYISSTGPVLPTNNYYDYGFIAKSGTEVFRTVARAHAFRARQMVASGLPVLRFEQSLVVEAKTNINGLTTPNSYAGAAYCLDW